MKQTALVLLILCSVTVHAQSTAEGNSIITDRPNQTESPFAVPRGIVQIESGLLFERYEISSTVSVHRNVYPINLFRIGLLDKFELRIVNEVVTYRSFNTVSQQQIAKVNGTENVQIGLKYQLTPDDSKVVTGLLVHGIFPTGSRGISNQRYGAVSRLNFSYDISDGRNIGVNLGYDNRDLLFTEQGLIRKANGNFVYTLAYSNGIGEKMGIFAEVYGNYVEFKKWGHNMDIGFTYLVSPTIQLDYVYGWGLNQVLNFHTVGISIRLPN